MFSYEEYYKLYNSREEAHYQEVRTFLQNHIAGMGEPSEKGFRDRMLRFSKYAGEYLLKLCELEESRTEEYLKAASLQELRNDQEAMYSAVMKNGYASGPASTMYMNSQAKEIGPVLAMFMAEFIRGAQDAVKHRRFMLLKKIELYFEMHKKIGRGQVRAEQLAGILKEYRSHVEETEEMLRLQEKFSPSDEYGRDLILNENLSEPYYLYEMGLPVGEEELGWFRTMNLLDAALLQKTADTMVSSLAAGIVREQNSYRSYRRYRYDRPAEGEEKDEKPYEPEMTRTLVAIDYPLGCEKLVLELLKSLEKIGMCGYLREVRTTALAEAFRRDHDGDRFRFMSRDFQTKHLETAQKFAETNRCLLKAYAGEIRILLPEEHGYDQLGAEIRAARSTGNRMPRLSGRYSLGAAEEKRKKYREFLQEEDQILLKEGGMEVGAQVLYTLPAYEETDPDGSAFTAKAAGWMETSLMEHHNERPMKAFCDALDRGSFLYLEGGTEKNAAGEEVRNETDLLIALRSLENPSRETKCQVSSGSGTMPAGGVWTIPQKTETNGLLHLVHTVIDGVEFNDLRLNFEDGVLTDYSVGGFEDPEEGKRFIREKLLHGGYEADLSELALGVHSSAWDDSVSEMEGTLPESMRESMDVSIVLGENRLERGDFDRMNAVTRKQVVTRPEPEEMTASEAVSEKDGGAQLPGETKGTAAAAVEGTGSVSVTGIPAENGETAAETGTEPAKDTAAVPADASERPADASKAAESEGGKQEGTEEMHTVQEHRRRYGYPLRKRIHLPYSGLDSMKIINENGSFSDIFRSQTFVLIGTDQLNMMKYRQ